MKCKYCNSDIEQDAQFCPNCGKDLSKFNKCVKCGELLDNDTVFCPHCGTEQPHEEIIETVKGSSKKWLLIIPLIILIVGAGAWYFFSDGFSFGEKTNSSAIEAEAVDSTMIETDIQSVDGITSRLYEIYINGFKLQDDEAVNKYFSEEFRALYKKVDEIDNNSGEMGFWEGNIWDGGQDGNPTDVEIMRVDKSSPTVALADVKLSYHNGDYHSNQKLSMTLVFENGNWFIDENNEMRFKERMKEYVNESGNASGSTTINNGTYSMAGKVSKYAIHMNIEINGSDANGYYYYDSQGSGNKVKLSGSIKEGGELTLKKFSNEGEETGYFEGLFNGVEYSGKNVNYNRDEDLQLSVTVE